MRSRVHCKYLPGLWWISGCPCMDIREDSERWFNVCAWLWSKVSEKSSSVIIHQRRCVGRSLTSLFLRELKVLVEQLLRSDIPNDLIMLINYLASTQCEKVCVCGEDDDLSLYFLETLIAGKCSTIDLFVFSISVLLENQTQRLSSLKLHLSLAFDLNQPKFASRILRANQDLPEEVSFRSRRKLSPLISHRISFN